MRKYTMHIFIDKMLHIDLLKSCGLFVIPLNKIPTGTGSKILK